MNKSIKTVYPVGQAKTLQEKDNSFCGVKLSKDLQFCKRSNKRQLHDSPTRIPGQGRNGYKRPLWHREVLDPFSKRQREKLRKLGLAINDLGYKIIDLFETLYIERLPQNKRRGPCWIKGKFFIAITLDELAERCSSTKNQIRYALKLLEKAGLLVIVQINESSSDQTRGYYIEGFKQWERARERKKSKDKNGGNSSGDKGSKAFTHVSAGTNLFKEINNLYNKYINHLLLTTATQPAVVSRSIFKLFKAIKPMCCNLKQALKRIPKFLRRMLLTRRKLTKDELNTLLIDMLPDCNHWLRKADMLGFLPKSCYNNEAGSIEWLIKLRKLSASVVIGMARACYGTNDLQSVAARLWKKHAPKLAKIKAEGSKVQSEHDMRAEFENIFINDKNKFVEWFYHPDCELQYGYTEEDLLLCETIRDIPSYTVDSMYKIFLQENGICNELRPISTTQPTIYQMPNTTTSKRTVFEIKKQDTAVSLGNMNLFAKWASMC